MRYEMAASTQVEFPFHRGIARQRGRGFGGLAQVIGELEFFFFRVNISSQLQSVWVLTCWNLLCQKLEMLLVVEGISNCKECGKTNYAKTIGQWYH